LLSASPSTSKFLDDGEHYYFQRFCCEVAPQLSWGSQWKDCGLWSRIILQASESESSIRHAVIALGALDYKEWAAWVSRIDKTDVRRQLAYREYHKSVILFWLISGLE
jgi:hypothetical protein